MRTSRRLAAGRGTRPGAVVDGRGRQRQQCGGQPYDGGRRLGQTRRAGSSPRSAADRATLPAARALRLPAGSRTSGAGCWRGSAGGTRTGRRRCTESSPGARRTRRGAGGDDRGGSGNLAAGYADTIGGGVSNKASSNSTVVGGGSSTSEGDTRRSAAACTTWRAGLAPRARGWYNQAGGDQEPRAGYQAVVRGAGDRQRGRGRGRGTFVWADAQGGPFTRRGRTSSWCGRRTAWGSTGTTPLGAGRERDGDGDGAAADGGAGERLRADLGRGRQRLVAAGGGERGRHGDTVGTPAPASRRTDQWDGTISVATGGIAESMIAAAR